MDQSYWESYFNSYAHAYVQGDEDKVKDFFVFPFVMVNQSGPHLVSTVSELSMLLKEFVTMLSQNHFQRFTINLKKLISLNKEQVAVVVHYYLYNKTGEVFLDFDFLYQLFNNNNSWHIKLVSLIRANS